MFRKQEVLMLNHSTDFSSLNYYFSEAGKELYLVGGCVRDLLLGRQPKDYDLCTNATPEEVIAILKDIEADWTEGDAISAHIRGEHLPDKRYSIIETGLKHGTVTIHDHMSNQFYEITTYRVDGKYSDNRHPDEVVFTPSLEEDLKRRDFTINSFAYDLNTSELVMLNESFLYDLKLGIIRAVGNPFKRFEEDALRMLRAIRFASQLGFSIDTLTFNAIKVQSWRLSYVSKERVKDELTKILLSDNPQMLEMVCLTGLETYIFGIHDRYPNLGDKDYRRGITPMTDMLNCEQHNKYHYTDVFHHTMDVIRRLPKDHDLRWAALLHDIGKPMDKTVDEEGWEHFYNHAEKSVGIATYIMEKLKFSNDSTEKILKFVKYHDYQLSKVNNKNFKKMLVEIGEDNFLDFLKLREADALAHKLSASTEFAIDSVSKCKERYKRLALEPQPLRLSDLAVNGYDMMNLGLKQSTIGKALNYCLEHVLEHPNDNVKEILIDLVCEKFLTDNN